ncbi:unnamed protein product [Discosporangium mesarthrocarpum]
MSSSSSIIKVKEKGEESVLDHSPVAKETKDIDKSVDRGLDESDFIKSTSSVLVHHSDGRTFFLDSGSKSNHAMIGRINVNTTPLIGERYGTVFQVERFTLKKVEGYDLVDPGSESSVTVDQIANDNRDFVDTNTAQKLTESDIRKMKEEGKESETIIKALVENSDTWRSKTQYSQQKWLQRKQKKYSPRIKVVKNTARNVCDAYFAKHREKVWANGASRGTISGESVAQEFQQEECRACLGCCLGGLPKDATQRCSFTTPSRTSVSITFYPQP